MKISIITACFNNEKTIKDTLLSVSNQTYNNNEHIIIDGKSSDKTKEIINQFPHISKVVSEPDSGIYDALNKGIKLATGDIIGFLHADDFFHHDTVLQEIADFFEKNPAVDAIYGDIVFVNEKGKIIRYYSSKNWNMNKMARGIMPAHTSFFARKKVYEKYPFNISYTIAADFDQVLKVALDKDFEMAYLPIITTSMRKGGKSTSGLQSNFLINKEVLRSCKEQGIRTTYFKIYSKYPGRLLELIKRNG